MKLAFLVNRFPSVSETFVADQLHALLDRGHSIDLYARAPGPNLTPALQARGVRHGLTLHYWPQPGPLARRTGSWLTGRVERRRLDALRQASGSALGLAELIARRRAAGGRRYDAVVAHFGPQGVDAELLRGAGALHGPLAVFFHGFDLSRLPREQGRALYAHLLQRAELLLPVSEHFRRRLIELGAPPVRVQVQRMGVHCSRIDFRSRSRAPAEPLRLLSVARLVEKKGLQVGIEAVARLARTVPLSWEIVGDGPLRGALERQIGATGAPVRLLGAQPREVVADRLAQCHVLLAPSQTSRSGDQEGVPVAIMEAMAHGAVVVSTAHSGIPEVIEPGVSGYLAREGDALDLEHTLRRCLDEQTRWPELAASARAFAERELDLAGLDARLEARLQQLAASAAVAAPAAAAAASADSVLHTRASSASGRASSR